MRRSDEFPKGQVALARMAETSDKAPTARTAYSSRAGCPGCRCIIACSSAAGRGSREADRQPHIAGNEVLHQPPLHRTCVRAVGHHSASRVCRRCSRQRRLADHLKIDINDRPRTISNRPQQERNRAREILSGDKTYLASLSAADCILRGTAQIPAGRRDWVGHPRADLI